MALDILIVDDEKDICMLISDILEDEGYTCRVAHSGSAAMAEVKKRIPHLILQDIWLGESSFDGLKVLEKVKQGHPDLPVVMMSGHGTIETAVSALKLGAYDFMEKPFNSTRLIILVEKALKNAELQQENASLKAATLGAEDLLMGKSDAILKLKDTIHKTAPTNSRIVLSGPQGSGKGTIAKEIHNRSLRQKGPFVALNCSNLKPTDVDPLLFGTEKENNCIAGVLEKAHKGTLFLEAVDEMPLETQGLMVKALHNQRFARIGGTEEVTVDVRVIASSTIDLKYLVDAKVFREDLYYRLAVMPIAVPSLQDRRDDIESFFKTLFSRALKSVEGRLDQDVSITIEPAAMVALKKYHWPGNCRQMQNVAEWIAIMKQHDDDIVISKSDLPTEVANDATKKAANSDQNQGQNMALDALSKLPLRDAREAFEKSYLNMQMDVFDGNVSKVAEFIGMERSALHRKLKTLRLKESEEVSPTDIPLKKAS